MPCICLSRLSIDVSTVETPEATTALHLRIVNQHDEIQSCSLIITPDLLPPSTMTTRHDFYQTDTHLIVSIYKKGVPADKVRVEAKPNQVCL